MTMTMGDHLTQAPDTDADHLQGLNDLAQDIAGLAARVEEYASTCEALGVDASAGLTSLQAVSEHLQEASAATSQAATDFEHAYAGVRETAASGVSMPGQQGAGDFWTGD